MVAFAAVLCTAGCGERPVLQDAAGKYRVVAVGTMADLAGPLRSGDVAVLVALDGDGGRADGPTGAGAPASPLIVAIGEQPAADASWPAALVVPETGAEVAVEMALLACNDQPLPPRIPVGARLYTDANRRAGGEAQIAPGDVAVALLRREHPAVLTTTPATDEIHQIALVTWRDDDPWQRWVAKEVTAAAGRYPQLALQTACADGDPARHDERIRAFLAGGARAVLVVAGSPAGLAAVAGDAAARGVAMIALDPALATERATCCIGCEDGSLGRAAAAGVRAILPGGGAIVLLRGGNDGAAIAAREQGFVDGLALRRP